MDCFMKITLKDIAEKAHVSTAAVSLAINNKPGISEKTKNNIMEVAKELKYNPVEKKNRNRQETIRFLKISRHGHTININHNYFIDAYIEGITSSALNKETVLEIETYPPDVPLSKIINRINESSTISGYIVLGTELSNNDISDFMKTGRNIVFIDTFYDYINADFVDMNNVDALYTIIKNLQQNGHTNIGLIKSSVQTRNFHLREQAFCQVMKDMGLELNSNFIIDVDSTFDGAYRDFAKHLEKNRKLPTAFFATNDIIAMGSMKALQEKGISIPDEISIAGFDNLPMGEMTFPKLSTYDVPKKEIGKTALELLLMQTAKPGTNHSIKTLISGRFIERESVRTL